MEFKIPPGNLSWLSALWILLGGYIGITSIQAGETALGGALLAFAFAGVLIWLDVRAIAWPLMVWFGIVIVSGVIVLAFRGLSFRPIWGILMAALTIYDLYAWRNSE